MELFLGFWDEVAGIFSGEGGGGEGDEGGANEIDEAIANVVKSNPFAPPRTSFRTHPTSPFANPSSSVSSSVSNYKSIQQEQQQQQQDEELDPDETPRPSTTGSSSSSFSSSSSSRPSTSSILTPYQQWKAAQRKHKGNYSEYTADLEKGKQKAEQQQHQNDDNDDAQQEEEEDEEETMEDKCARIFNVGDKDKFLKKYARSVNQNERVSREEDQQQLHIFL